MKLADYMTIWAEWMQGDSGVAPEELPGVASGCDEAITNYATSVEDSANAADMREASYGPIIDACVDSLDTHEKLAVHHVFGFSRHMRLVGMNPAQVYLECQPKLARLIDVRLPVDDLYDVVYARRPGTR